MRTLSGVLIDAAADLFLGAACLGCGRPGRPLCSDCRDGLPGGAAPVWPSPTPPGLAPPYATGAYDATLRALVLAHKERRLLACGEPLGRQLAASVATALLDLDVGPVTPAFLVPVPSRPGAVRRRAHDPTLAMTRRAAARLRRTGRPVVVVPLLRLRPGVADQAGLNARERHANLVGSMACRTGLLARTSRRWRLGHVVVCDDVITTGATAREAQRALEAVGVPVLAVAAVAATRRRRPDSARPLSPADVSD